MKVKCFAQGTTRAFDGVPTHA